MVRAVPKHVLDPKTAIILDDFGRYFREFPEATQSCSDEFITWFNTFAHPKFNDDQRAFYKTLLTEARCDVSEAVEAGLMDRLVAADTASKLTDLLMKYQEGDEIDLLPALRATVEQFELDTNRKVKTPWVQDPIEDLLKDDEHDRGFHWRLQPLDDCMRPLRPGDFGIIAGRPDKGKTTFLTDQLTHFAAQVDDIFPGENRTILWFNNEGPGNRIVKRLYQSALYATTSEMVENKNLRADYLRVTGGRPDIIRVFDIHDFWNHEVEDIIRGLTPALIVFDMVDNIKFGGSVNNNGQRTDQLLEAMYQWARVIGVKHDCVVLAASQISADGENLAYPTLSMLKDSKTGKQGAADFILTLGALDDFPNNRFLGCTKNKLQREKSPKTPKAEVIFDGQRGRYVEPENFTGAQ
jgi:replicative DNA helicase